VTTKERLTPHLGWIYPTLEESREVTTVERTNKEESALGGNKLAVIERWLLPKGDH
jgi:hypothetical protein